MLKISMLEYSALYISGIYYKLKGMVIRCRLKPLSGQKANGMVAWYECLNLLPVLRCVGE